MRNIAYWLTVGLIGVMPWEGIIVIPGLGTLSRVFAICVGIFWLAAVLLSGTLRKPAPFHGLVFVLFLWSSASILWTVDADETLVRSITMLQMTALTYMLWDLCLTPRSVRRGLQAYVIGAFVPCMSTIGNYVAGSATGWYRYAATGSGPNATGVVVALGLPLAFYLAACPRQGAWGHLLRLVNYGYLLVGVFAMSLTATRFALIMTAVACAYGITTLVRFGLVARVLLVLALSGSFLVLAVLVPESSIERLSTVGTEITEGDLNARTGFWREGLETWAEHPIFGVGAGAYQSKVESGRAAHNSFVALLAELGPVGLVLFGLVPVAAFRCAWAQPKWEFAFWFVVLIELLLANSVLTLAHTKQTWLFLGLLVASGSTSEVSHNEIALPGAAFSDEGPRPASLEPGIVTR